MKIKMTAVLFWLLLCGQQHYKLPKEISPHFRIQTITSGVYAVINNDNYGHAISNAGIIDLGNETIVFDAMMNPDAAADLKAAAIRLTGKPVKYVINSHYHDDHIRGNQVFVPGAAIISTPWIKNEIAETEPEELAWAIKNGAIKSKELKEKLKIATGADKEELPMWIAYYDAMDKFAPLIKTTLPTITFTDSLWIYGTKRNIKLIECKNGHTGSDVLAYLPGDSILFMGDLLFENRHPYLADGDAGSWLNYLQQWENNQAVKYYVPGHGNVCNKTDVNKLHEYIYGLQQMIHEAVVAGEPDSVISKKNIPVAFSNWWFKNFYTANISFLLKQERKQQ
jgi:glyoxylase-like metal-dependent hydrolase (beta-lactamase superfamily II)